MGFEWPVLPRVESLVGISPDNLKDQLPFFNKPLVLKDFGKDWPLVKAGKISGESALSYLQRFYSNIPITTCYGDPETKGRIYYNENFSGFNFKVVRQPLSLFIKEFIQHKNNANSPALYIPSTDVNEWFPQLDLENSAGIDELNPVKFIWVGNQTRIAAHYDFPSNIACCVAGRRRFTLFPPDQVVNLYPGPLDFAPGGQEISLVNFDAVDIEKFPKFSKALEAAVVAELEPGDALFLPGMWWHHVEGLEAINVLYTHWWRESPSYLGRPTNALMHAVMSLRDLSYDQRQAWKALFNHYVFDRDITDIENIPETVRGILASPVKEADVKQCRADLAKRLNQ